MTDFQITRDDRTIEFTVKTTELVSSFHSTVFVPTHCEARIQNGAIVSLMLEERDGDGWAIEDPANPEGAELNVGYGGGEITAEGRKRLPTVAQEALTAVESAIRSGH